MKHASEAVAFERRIFQLKKNKGKKFLDYKDRLKKLKSQAKKEIVVRQQFIPNLKDL